VVQRLVSMRPWLPEIPGRNRGLLFLGEARTNPTPRPPINAEFLLHLLMSPEECDGLVGDLEERFNNLVPRIGQRLASIWYTKQVVTSLCRYAWPLFDGLVPQVSSVSSLWCYG
jgi:hypothetical protein